MEDLVTEFKIVKQKRFKKLRKLESFNQMKIDFFKKLPDQGDLNVKKEPKKKKAKILMIKKMKKKMIKKMIN